MSKLKIGKSTTEDSFRHLSIFSIYLNLFNWIIITGGG